MDMKKILQAMDGVSTKPVEGVSDMSKFVNIIKEGANPHKVTLPVQMAMQHYSKPVEKKQPKTSIIGKYFTEAEELITAKQEEKKSQLRQYASIIAERVRLKESTLKDKDDLTAKRKALHDLSLNKDVDQKVVRQRKLDLEKEAKEKKLAENTDIVAVDNPTDEVTVDVPLLIRLLEFAREDAQTDMDLHQVTEKLISLSAEGRTLSMDDYELIVGQQEQ